MVERKGYKVEKNEPSPSELLSYLQTYYADKEFTISEIEKAIFGDVGKKSLVGVFSQIINNGITMSGSRENPNNPRANTIVFKVTK